MGSFAQKNEENFFQWKTEKCLVRRLAGSIKLLCLLLALAVRADDLKWLDDYNIQWTKPSVNSAESMPCGGGDIGLNVWVENGDILFYMDRSGNIDENDQQLKTGRFRIRLAPNPLLPCEKFKQELKLRTGHVEIEAQNSNATAVITIWVEVSRPIVHVDIKAERPLDMMAAFENWRHVKKLIPRTPKEKDSNWDWDYNRWSTLGYFGYEGNVYTFADTIDFRDDAAVVFYHQNDNRGLLFDKESIMQRVDVMTNMLVNPSRDRIFGGLMSGDGMGSIGSAKSSYLDTPSKTWYLQSTKPAKKHHVRIFLHTEQVPEINKWQRNLLTFVALRKSKDSSAWHENAGWWNDFWERSHIVINPGKGPEDQPWRIGRNYQLMRYMLACNANGEWPTRFNGGLFTYDPVLVNGRVGDGDFGWKNPDYRAWGAWVAQNQRLLYWPMLKSGDFDVILPQFDFYRKNLSNARARSQVSWGIPFASFFEKTDSGGLPSGGCYGWIPPYGNRDATRETGMPVQIPTYYTTALEFSYMMLEWARYGGGDIRTYLPFIKDSVAFHFEFFTLLEKRRTGQKWGPDGKLVINPAQALEAYVGTNSTDIICALRRNLECLTNLSLISTAEKSTYKDWLSRLPEINFHDRNGHKAICPIKGEPSAVYDTEIPQLYPVFPWGYYGVGQPDLLVAVDTWRHGLDGIRDNVCLATNYWFGWAQQSIFLARMGMATEAADYLIRKLDDARGNNDFNSGKRMRFPAFWGPGFDWTPDHSWGGSGMIALQEMVLQTPDRRLLLLPAWPKEWAVDFKLCAPGKTVVEGQFKDGQLISVDVSPSARKKDIVHTYKSPL